MTLVVRGEWPHYRLRALRAGAGAGLVVALALAGLAQVQLPWIPDDPAKFLEEWPIVPAALVVFAFGTTVALARGYFLRRSGRVELGDEGVLFARGPLARGRVRWSELAAYSDASSASVDLVRRGEFFARASLAIPTRDEATRTAVLGALDARGLRRTEAHAQGRAFVRAALAGGCAVLVFLALVHLANAPWRRFQELKDGRLLQEDAAAVVSGTVSVGHVVEIGSVRTLNVATAVELPTLALFVWTRRTNGQVYLRTTVSLDGQVLDDFPSFVTIARVHGYDPFLRFHVKDSGNVLYVRPRLTPGKHVVRAVTRMPISDGFDPVPYVTIGETERTIEVEPD